MMNANRTRIAASGMVAAATALGFAVGLRGGPEPRREVTPPAPALSACASPEEHPDSALSEIAALRADIAHVKQQLAALDAPRSARPTDGSPDAIAGLRRDLAHLQDDVAANAPPPESSAADVERQRREQRAELEAKFLQEPDDARWSRQASTSVLDALEDPDAAGLEVRSVSCRSRTCRIELASGADADADKMLPVFLDRMGRTLPTVTSTEVENADGTRSTILYATMSRETAPAGSQAAAGRKG